MKTDWRIMGRPYRGARSVLVLKAGLMSAYSASLELMEGIKAGKYPPNAWVQSKEVSDNYDPTKRALRIRVS